MRSKKATTGGPCVVNGETLYRREFQLPGGRTQTVYVFARAPPAADATPCTVPTGYRVVTLPKSGRPVLQRIVKTNGGGTA